jgi:hypothetical protein
MYRIRIYAIIATLDPSTVLAFIKAGWVLAGTWRWQHHASLKHNSVLFVPSMWRLHDSSDCRGYFRLIS